MKFRVYHAYDENRHGTASIVRATQAEIDHYFWNDAFDHSDHLDADTVEELKALFNNDVSEAMASCRPYTSWGIDTDEIDLAPTVPKEAVEAARTAVEALAFARDCLKAAGAVRAANKTRLALSSAKGAVRHAENKSYGQVDHFIRLAAKHDAAVATARSARERDWHGLKAEGKI
ncbi:hypothetical protein [Mesorhizobium sp. WSM4887]|uniref:hypothetical protein n=1 Tax=Mesorhizobium sp. WSM4887 TaxID=3038543 RepID=UPI0024177D0A|nr:hypothetical protein [Mesorhizobium sp. WSM4887]MDG4889706.1 hypothetical protein [Mesorhizobium sp. WSM4887]